MKISFLTPTYNHEKYIGKCIESVLTQTYLDVEQVIIDDGSTDRTGEIARDYIQRSNKIKYFHQNNKGIHRLNETYNFGLSKCTGEIIAILEGDDWAFPDRAKLQATEFLDPNVIVSWGISGRYDDSGEFLGISPDNPEDFIEISAQNFARMMLIQCYTSANTVAIRKSVLDEIGGFQKGEYYVDYPTWLALIPYGKFQFMNTIISGWGFHGDNNSIIMGPKARPDYDAIKAYKQWPEEWRTVMSYSELRILLLLFRIKGKLIRIRNECPNLKTLSGVISDQITRKSRFHLFERENKNTFFKDRKGLEIGGPSGIFYPFSIIPIYGWAKIIDNCNYSENTLWSEYRGGQNFEYTKGKKGEQYICEASELPILDKSYDFVLNSHVIEHLTNPIKALNEWKRVTIDNGVILTICPHKEGTHDHLRPTTELNHLIRDFQEEIQEDDLSHLEEIIELHDLSRDPSVTSYQNFVHRSRNNIKNRSLHHHTFITESVIKLFDYMDLEILYVNTYRPWHIILLGKVTRNNSAVHGKNKKYLNPNAEWRKKSCFNLDRR